jgi:hypothetical protein
MSGNYSTVGKSWPRIQEAHIRAIFKAAPPHCVYHVGIVMKRIETVERSTMTSGNVAFVSLNYRCPVPGCPCVSGRTNEEDEQ